VLEWNEQQLAAKKWFGRGVEVRRDALDEADRLENVSM
jgi:hypothetical protein